MTAFLMCLMAQDLCTHHCEGSDGQGANPGGGYNEQASGRGSQEPRQGALISQMELHTVYLVYCHLYPHPYPHAPGWCYRSPVRHCQAVRAAIPDADRQASTSAGVWPQLTALEGGDTRLHLCCGDRHVQCTILYSIQHSTAVYCAVLYTLLYCIHCCTVYTVLYCIHCCTVYTAVLYTLLYCMHCCTVYTAVLYTLLY